MTHANGPTDQPALTVTSQDTEPHARVLSVTGDIDLHQLGPLEHALAEALRKSPPLRLLVLDLTAVGFCDSSGLNVLLKARQETEAHDIQLRLVSPGMVIRRLLQVTGTAAFFSLYDDLAQALA
ncbi:STAS domain-containing protein [Streptomyces sp. NPDC005244]|uniref:STAS domain-containing protein n=1 Tax=Streptomyces sp. NPDC005244 TaxID=3364708 RepID=UPI00369FDC5C